MKNKQSYLDQRNDFTGPEKGKRGYPNRPEKVQIKDENANKSTK
ncbi:hypothetical protein [Mesobacillus maritimus]|nr:hypothetical protein [Mesobacillus maritimus]